MRQVLEGAGQLADHPRGGVSSSAPHSSTRARCPERSGLVLIVEDNVALNRQIAESLASEYRIVSAFDGEEGLEKAIELVPDAIITDVMMPGCDSEGLVHRIRACAGLDGVPIIVLTSSAEDGVRLRLLQSGAQDYLMKPCIMEEVRTRVTNLVTLKRARETLQDGLDSSLEDLEVLAKEASQRKRDLQAALEAMGSARDEADQLSRHKSDFLGLVSHELRTPLTAIRLQLDQVIHDCDTLSPNLNRVFNRLDAACARMISLVESLLQHARIQGGRIAVERERFPVERVVFETIQELQALADQKGLALEFAAIGQHVIDSDPHVLRLVLSNLIQNAIKFTSKGTVSVSVQDEDGKVAIAVADSGLGIAPMEHGRIFEPFEQVETVSNKRSAGIGLGLALVREMLPLLQGSMKLDSDLGSGSVFTVTLPVAPTGRRLHPTVQNDEPLGPISS